MINMARIITRKNLEENNFMQHFSEDKNSILDTILYVAKKFDSNNSVDLLKEINTNCTLLNRTDNYRYKDK